MVGRIKPLIVASPQTISAFRGTRRPGQRRPQTGDEEQGGGAAIAGEGNGAGQEAPR
jgi:hypothetical protein